MSETEIPSKTDPSPNDAVKNIQLASGELEYLRSLQEQNKQLTLILGDKAMEYEYAKKALYDHREVLTNAYKTTLSIHGVDSGRIDLVNGVVSTLPKN